MTVKRFVGATARDALRLVKEALGPDAVVVSNKPTERGVEILAMSPDSLDALSQSAGGPTAAVPPAPTLAPRQPTPPDARDPRAGAVRNVPPASNPPQSVRPAPAPSLDADDDYRVTLSGARRQAAVREQAAAPSRAPDPTVRPWVPPGAVPKAAAPSMPGPGEGADPSPRLRPLSSMPPHPRERDDVLPAAQVAAHLRSAAAPAGSAEEPAIDGLDDMASMPSPQMLALMDEMRTIKGLLERQLAGFAWGEMAKEAPVRALLLAEMLEAGFSGALARRLVQEMPDGGSEEDCRRWLRAAVNRRLRTLPADADFIDRGGVFALVGPTGVGKTTTTAKLAARCVVRYGADRLALLTTDGYRIGAHEQLRIYGRILGVPVFTVRDGDDLRRTLADLRDKHMILIDTVGMSQRDRMVAEQAALLSRSGQVNRLLLLNAGARGDLLDDVVRAYSGDNLAGCILTKVDEAPSLAPAIDCVVRNGLTLSYVANGQRVPEDLHLPNRTYLLHRAFKLGAGETAHKLRPDELPLVMPTPTTASAASAARAQGYPLA